jgi:hypothetical protein
MPTVLAKLGIIKENKDFGNKNSNPTTMAQMEAQCLPYWPSMGVKNEKQKREILTITISDFYVQIYKKATQETLKGGLQYF